MMKRLIDTEELAVYISAQSRNDGEKPYYWVRVDEGTPDGWLKIHQVAISIPRPTRDEILPQQVAAFRSEIVKVRVSAEAKVQLLEKELGELLALEAPPNNSDIPF